MEFKKVTAENEDSQNLYRFFGLLARFNNGRQLPKETAHQLEEYFNYYWAHDKNYSSKSVAGKRFLSELPKQIRISVNTKFDSNDSFLLLDL